MTYSCGIHKQGSTLHEAQMAKLDSLIKKAGIQPTDHVLEIGCGWGSFAIRAVQQTGCKVTGKAENNGLAVFGPFILMSSSHALK